MRYDVPDPAWKRDPDIVADESFTERYEEDEESGLPHQSEDWFAMTDPLWAASVIYRNNRGGFR